MATNPDTLKQLSDSIDAYASAKVSNNETLIKFSIGSLQQFFQTHDIVPLTEDSGATEDWWRVAWYSKKTLRKARLAGQI